VAARPCYDESPDGKFPENLTVRMFRWLNQMLTQKIRREQSIGEYRYDRNLLTWGKHYLPGYFVRKPSRMHEWLSEQLQQIHETRGTKLNVIGPRGGAKSTLGSLCYVLRAAVEGWERYIWIISDTKDQARTHLENLKHELLENRRLAKGYPRSVGRGPQWRATSITLQNGVVIESFGTGQSLRGRRHQENRPTLIICDDLENDSHMQSVAQREASRQWFEGTLLKAGTKETNVINLATALHRDALAMRLNRTPGWESQVFQAITKWPDNTQLWNDWETIYSDVENPTAKRQAWNYYQKNRAAMDAGAELLWPEEEDLYTLMKMRVEAGHTAFNREKQSSPVDPERCEWPEEYFGEHLWFDEWPAHLLCRVMALDPSKGRDSRHGDYSAFVVLGVDRHGVLHVEADLARRPTPQIVADGVVLCQRFGVAAFGVEANQFQELLADEFTRALAEHGLRDCQPCAIHNSVNKQLRIRRLGPYLSQRRFRFHKTSPGTQLVVDQLRDFPLGSHDDGPDALEMALRLVEEFCSGHTRDDGLGERLVRG